MILRTARALGWIFSRVAKLIMWLILAYPPLLVLMYYTSDAYLPNGGVLNRNIDFDSLSRIDLYRSEWGDVIVRDVQLLCWNDYAIQGGGFIWLGGDHEVIGRNDPRYMETLRRSGLLHPDGGCNGYYRAYMGAEMLVDRYCPALQKPASGTWARCPSTE